MIIYKVKEVLSKKGVTPYRLYADKVLTNPTWENFKKGGDLSLKVLDKLCTYLNCGLTNLVEYAKDDSFEAKSHLIKKKIEERKFDEEFETLCESSAYSYELCKLSKLYNDCIDVREDEIIGWMYDAIKVEKICLDFEEAVSYAKEHPELQERFQHLECLKELHEELVSGVLYVIQADGSLSRLCNLRDRYCFGELLDCYLDEWRKEHTRYDDETGEVVGTDYLNCYDISNSEIIPQLSDKEFKDLVDVIDNAFGFEKDAFGSYINDFIEKFENEDNE